jgi:hypothetical protein
MPLTSFDIRRTLLDLGGRAMSWEHIIGGSAMVLDDSRKPLAVIAGVLSERLGSVLSAELAGDILAALKVEGMSIYRADGGH